MIADIGPWDPTHPPRPALQPDIAGGFRIEGAETGLVEGLAGARLEIRIDRPADGETRNVEVAGVGERWRDLDLDVDG